MGTKEYWEQELYQPSRSSPDEQDLFSGYWVKRYIANLKHLGTGKHILDIGCGNAKYFTRLESKFEELYGIELSNEHFKVASKLFPDGRYIVADGLRLPFQDNSFDAILSVGAFEHNEDICAIFEECHRVLRSGGTLLFSVPNYISTYFPYCYIVHRLKGDSRVESIGYHFSKRKLRRELETSGFGEIKFVDTIYAVPFPLVNLGMNIYKLLQSPFSKKTAIRVNHDYGISNIPAKSKVVRLAEGLDDTFTKLFYPLEYLGLGFMRVVRCIKTVV